NGQQHITDVSNASRTLLYNIHTCEWDKSLLRLFRIPASMLPEVRASSEPYGVITASLGLSGVPVAGIAGDQQAALFGQMCIRPVVEKITYRTGCSLLQNTGTKRIPSKNRLVSTIRWRINGRPEYAQVGCVFIDGAAIQWLRDGLQLVRSAP